jgi:hypothetical protein
LSLYLKENIKRIDYKDNLVKQFREITAVYFENHLKHINTLCGQNTELKAVEGAGA